MERIDRQIETSEDTQIESVNALGERLLFDRCGPRGLVGNGPDIKTKHERKLKTSSSGVAEDPDSPRKLVQELKNSAFGCMWLRGHWEELKAQLEPGKHWNGPDRFLAVRLLGRQPADATFDRTIALIYVACDGLNLSEASAFQDLLSDMHESQLDRLRRGMEERWPELFEIERTEECRQILIDLVEENLAELNARIAEFEGVTDVTAQKDLTRDKGDVTPEGSRLLNHIQKSRNGLSRGIASFTRYQNTCSQRDKGDPSGGQEPRRTKEAVPDSAHSTASGRRFARGGNEREALDLDWAVEAGAALDRGAGPTCDINKANARGDGSVDVMLETILADGGTDSDELTRLDCDGGQETAEFESETARARYQSLHAQRCDTAAGTLLTPDPEGDGGETHAAGIETNGENATNEANFDENVSNTEPEVAADVMANSGAFLWT